MHNYRLIYSLLIISTLAWVGIGYTLYVPGTLLQVDTSGLVQVFNAKDATVLGIMTPLLFMFIYTFIMFIFYPKNNYTLVFSILLLALCLLSFMGENILNFNQLINQFYRDPIKAILTAFIFSLFYLYFKTIFDFKYKYRFTSVINISVILFGGIYDFIINMGGFQGSDSPTTISLLFTVILIIYIFIMKWKSNPRIAAISTATILYLILAVITSILFPTSSINAYVTPAYISFVLCITGGLSVIVKFSDVVKETLAKEKEVFEFNSELGQKVKERTKDVLEQKESLSSMIENLHQGIFQIALDADHQLTIYGDYTYYLENIFERKDLAESSPIDLLFSQSDISGDIKEQVQAALMAAFGESPLAFEVNEELLVKHISIEVNGNIKYLDLEWTPIVDEEDIVVRVMVIVSEVTDLMDQMQKNKDLEKIVAITTKIVSVGVEKIGNFLTHALSVAENLKMFEQADQTILFRDVHTLKGNARTFKFNGISDIIHEIESNLKASAPLAETYQFITELSEEIDIIQKTLMRFAPGENRKEKVNQQIICQITEKINQMDSNINLDQITQEIFDLARLQEYLPLGDIIREELESISGIAEGVGKVTPNIYFKAKDVYIIEKMESLMKNVFVHCMRNAIDHGIEDAKTRESKGKSPQGSITIDSRWEKENLKIDLYDDGAGLNLGALRKKSQQEDASDETIASKIFEAGVSTAASVTTISGRGVGMDAVKNFLNKNGGDINIEFTGDFKDGFRPFKLVLELPKRCAIRYGEKI